MPRREDIEKIVILGSGPIVIGQACEFDYSGNQAVRALKEEGYHVILLNPNPATMMTTPGNAHSIYFDPLEKEYLIDILKKEKPDAILPTMGGQNALNLVMSFEETELKNEYGVELIGAGLESIRLAEDRGLFKQLMSSIGLKSPLSALVRYEYEAWKIIEKVDYPIIIRPSFTLGGRGGSIAYSKHDFSEKLHRALSMSPVHTALVEESLLGYQEFEFEVMRDVEDNAMVVCAIENIDPMGVHTGDSITVAPIQTLSDAEYQLLRSASIDIIRAIGMECGGSNVQFAYKMETQRLLVIEMNPRVSRSSALASKVTGFPIARIATKLAVGYTLNEVMNEITRNSTSFFEPALDYCAVKVPKFDTKKFPITELGTQMQSIGEALAFGVHFCEALNKAMRSVEMEYDVSKENAVSDIELEQNIRTLHPRRIFAIYTLLYRLGETAIEKIASITGFHPWVLYHISKIAEMEKQVRASQNLEDETVLASVIRDAKVIGFTNTQLAQFLNKESSFIDVLCKEHDIEQQYRCVDTCAAEFPARTPYFYSTHSGSGDLELHTTEKERVLILGSGPNRVGQGLEFDTCCTLATLAFQRKGYEVAIINCNPETVSTDYNIADILFFEPLHIDDVLSVLQATGIQKLVVQLDFLSLVRPSYVLGGRAMAILYSASELLEFIERNKEDLHDTELLIDSFLEDAVEYDVDIVSDRESVYIAGVLKHIEPAGIHSGDSACIFTPEVAHDPLAHIMYKASIALARRLNIKGFLNIQFASVGKDLYILEANPRASRTIPFISKTSGVDLVDMAVSVWNGEKLSKHPTFLERRMEGYKNLAVGYCTEGYAVKESVFSFDRFEDADPVLGPEMKSTGEAIGIGESFGEAFAKASIVASTRLPKAGTVFVSINVNIKTEIFVQLQRLTDMGFTILANKETAELCISQNIPSALMTSSTSVDERIQAIGERMQSGRIDLVVSISQQASKELRIEEKAIRRSSLRFAIPYVSTTAACMAAVDGIEYIRNNSASARKLRY
ncbi:carbamoyl-phosphate synthase large chain, N-terminal section-like [Ylistrum balloti]|uniref:carbamoyl-phosphate synthase large chain, N-terminal section-like n=1 Tax=Ylistrum balloti TaxID=509963 RepID=UPI002905F78B|nr:carbamoyl-phosphate synthase large chain, N-terminal section-like [Ylistrum balloti]